MDKKEEKGFFDDLGDPNNPVNIFEKGNKEEKPKKHITEVKSPGLAAVLSFFYYRFRPNIQWTN